MLFNDVSLCAGEVARDAVARGQEEHEEGLQVGDEQVTGPQREGADVPGTRAGVGQQEEAALQETP